MTWWPFARRLVTARTSFVCPGCDVRWNMSRVAQLPGKTDYRCTCGADLTRIVAPLVARADEETRRAVAQRGREVVAEVERGLAEKYGSLVGAGEAEPPVEAEEAPVDSIEDRVRSAAWNFDRSGLEVVLTRADPAERSRLRGLALVECTKYLAPARPEGLAERRALIDAILAQSADIEARGTDGQTPLWQAADLGLTDLVRLYLERGAEVDAPDDNGTPPLFRAAVFGHAEVVEVLLAHGADPAWRSVISGKTALSGARARSKRDVVAVLEARGAPD